MKNYRFGGVSDIIHGLGFGDVTDINKCWSKLIEALESIGSDFKPVTSIETIIPTSQGEKYLTVISFKGDVANYFPVHISDSENEFWKIHNSKVDEALQSTTCRLLKLVQIWEHYFALNLSMALSLSKEPVAKKNRLVNLLMNLKCKFRNLLKI